MDPLTPSERSRIMSLVKSKNTRPELLVRKIIHRMGYRYRLHKSDLAGSPDIVFTSRRKVIFIHGCFWHRHNCANGRRLPRSRVEFWENKLKGNRKRDLRNIRSLKRDGWKILVVWECQIATPAFETKLHQFLK
ncbi:MAG TPA: very short patch repair endonuclease [Phycisphaerae bacterium]|nr:very short patch repair endonuclease [Phycisphaerae bacterium]